MRSIVFIICLLVAVGLSSQRSHVESKVDPLLEKIMADMEIPGMSVLVSKNGEEVYSGAFGFADLAKDKKVNRETMFRMASVSKMFAASAIAILVEEDKVDLDDPIEKYLSDYPHKDRGVTIRRVLNHTSGVRHYGKGDRYIDLKKYRTTADALKIFYADELNAEPGTEYQYSTHAYTLLAAVIEEVSEMTYLEFLQEKVFEPLRMERSMADVKGDVDSNQSQLYNGMKKVKFIDNPSYKRAGGGMLSTASDLAKFGEAHMRPGFLSKETLDALFEPTVDMQGSLIPTEVGMGWRISKDAKGDVIFHHAGSMSGARSFLMLSPSDSIVLAIMTNNRELGFIDYFGLMVRDIVKNDAEGVGYSELLFEENCSVKLTGMDPYFRAEISYPAYFDQAQEMHLVGMDGEDGTVFRNLKVGDEILYLQLSKEYLVIYVKDEAGQWEKKELQIKL